MHGCTRPRSSTAPLGKASPANGLGRAVCGGHNAIRSRIKHVAKKRLGNDQHTGAIAGVGADMDGGRTHRFGQSDVLRAVSDHPGGGQVEVERRRGGSGHAGHRLSVDAGVRELWDRPLRMVRAVEELVDVGTVLCEQAGEVAVHLFDIADVVEPSSDTGLVGHHRHRDAGPVEPGDRLCGAVDELDSIDGPDVAVIDDDRPVPVEQDAWCGIPTSLSSLPSTRCQRTRSSPSLNRVDRGRGPLSRADRICSGQFGQLSHALLEQAGAHQIHEEAMTRHIGCVRAGHQMARGAGSGPGRRTGGSGVSTRSASPSEWHPLREAEGDN